MSKHVLSGRRPKRGATAALDGLRRSRAQPVRVKTPEAVVDAYLASSPLSLALFRMIEAKSLAGLVLGRPLLEIGCGDGQFVRMALSDPVDVGIDISRRRLERARKGENY